MVSRTNYIKSHCVLKFFEKNFNFFEKNSKYLYILPLTYHEPKKHNNFITQSKRNTHPLHNARIVFCEKN